MVCIIPNLQAEIWYYTEKYLSKNPKPTRKKKKKRGIVQHLLNSSDSEEHLPCSSVQMFF